MTSQTTTIKNGTIVLPKAIRKAWQGAEVYITAFGDNLFVYKLTSCKMNFTEMVEEMRKAARKAGITKKDVEEAIREVRREAGN